MVSLNYLVNIVRFDAVLQIPDLRNTMCKYLLGMEVSARLLVTEGTVEARQEHQRRLCRTKGAATIVLW